MTEEKKQDNCNTFGLLGKNISYSFSSGYFKEKFDELELLHYQYKNFEIQSIQEFPLLLKQNNNLHHLSIN